MNNLFDSDNYPDTEPDSIIAGSRIDWTRSDITSTYPTATYTLTYKLKLQDSGWELETITASKVSSAHVVELSTSTTAGYKAGDYRWQAIIVRDSDSESIVLDEGFVSVKAQTGDIRSHNLIVLQAIRATIEGTATNEQAEYSINGRTLKRRSVEELVSLEQLYASRWASEQAAIDRENGRSSSGRVLIKMGA